MQTELFLSSAGSFTCSMRSVRAYSFGHEHSKIHAAARQSPGAAFLITATSFVFARDRAREIAAANAGCLFRLFCQPRDRADTRLSSRRNQIIARGQGGPEYSCGERGTIQIPNCTAARTRLEKQVVRFAIAIKIRRALQ